MDQPTLERLIRRSNPTLDAERSAIAAGRWAEYLAERVPAPSRVNALKFAAWKDATRQALERGYHTRPRKVFVFPIWYCHNDGAGPSEAWTRTIVVSYDDGTVDLVPGGGLGDEIVMAVVQQARVGVLIDTTRVAQDAALAFRNAHYGVLETPWIEAVAGVERTIPARGVPRPARPVPEAATAAELAIATDTIDPDIGGWLERVVAHLRFTPS